MSRMPITSKKKPMPTRSRQMPLHGASKSSRMIEEGLLELESSNAGFSERYRRGETPHTIHVWWARRPYSAMRSLVFSALADSGCKESREVLKQISRASVLDAATLKTARETISRTWTESPRVLDMFGGGGTIPYEAATLGVDTYSIDSNELAVFLQQTLLSFAPKVKGLPALVAKSGQRVLERLAETTRPLFPKRSEAFAYIWSYSWNCSECGYRFSLVKRPWLSKKGDKRIALSVKHGKTGDELSVEEVPSDYAFEGAWTGRNGTVSCPKCKATCKTISIDRANDEVVAVVSHSEGSGKTFKAAANGCSVGQDAIKRIENAALRKLNAKLPASKLPRWSGIVNPSLYGIETHADFLGPRQRAVLLLLLVALREEYESLLEKHSKESAKAVISVLSGLVDQLVDWNCRLSMWISQNEQVGRAFSGPGVPMLWDYAELDPAANGPANLWSKLKRLVAGTKALENIESPVHVQKAYAQSLPFEDSFFDAVVTDPPYYDNIYYNVLADFFYAWKKLLFKEISPELFGACATDSSRELVASTFRSGDTERAHEDYCEQLGKAVSEAARVLKKEGVFCLVYSHSSIRGWEAVLRAYRGSAIEVASVQPLSIERKARPRAMTSEAVNTCVVFVARKSQSKKTSIDSKTFDAAMRSHLESTAVTLRNAGWAEQDVGLAVFAKGVGTACNFTSVEGVNSNHDLMREIERHVQVLVPDFRIVDRKSL